MVHKHDIFVRVYRKQIPTQMYVMPLYVLGMSKYQSVLKAETSSK